MDRELLCGKVHTNIVLTFFRYILRLFRYLSFNTVLVIGVLFIDSLLVISLIGFNIYIYIYIFIRCCGL